MSMVELPILKEDGTVTMRNVNADKVSCFPCVPLNCSIITTNKQLSDTDCIVMVAKMKCADVRAKLETARRGE